MDHILKTIKAKLEKYKGLFKCNCEESTTGKLMTALKMFCLTYKLKLTLNRRIVLVENKTGKVYFQGQKVTVLIQNNYQQARDVMHNIENSCFAFFLYKMVLNFACLIFGRSFFS